MALGEQTMKHLLASIFLVLLVTGCDKISQAIGSYDDCLLSNMKGFTASHVIEAVKAACKQKYPKEFDFSEIARGANVKSWLEVVAQEGYSSKTNEIKEEIRRQYFTDVIQSRVHPDYIVEAGTQFESYSRKIVKEVSNSTPAESPLSKPETGNASSAVGAVVAASDSKAQPIAPEGRFAEKSTPHPGTH